MPRLVHSYSGLLRAMQMSRIGLHVFVEGVDSDAYFYAGLCDSCSCLDGITYELSPARQIPGDSGGKQTLLQFFECLRRRRKLTSVLGGKKTIILFFVDKDVDDLQHAMRRSKHVIYTEHYDAQNYIFLHGDLVRGAAAAASVDPQVLRAELSDSDKWCKQAILFWREWICLCLCMLENRMPCEANFRVHSQVQTRPYGPTDPAICGAFLNTLSSRRGVSIGELQQRLTATRNRVERYLARSQHHRIFKGKWFSFILEDCMAGVLAGRHYNKNGLASRLACTVAATLNFTESWGDYFRDRITEVMSMV